jgi:hypothetical protein
MISIVLVKALSMGIMLSAMLITFTELSTAAISGIVAGLVVGAIIVPLMQVPDALGRALLIGTFFALGMAGYQLVQILSATGGSLGSILNALESPVVGKIILNGVLYTLYAFLVGALIGVFITVPDRALKGGLIGMVFGVIIGTVLYWGLDYFGINVNPTIFRLLTGFLVFGVLSAITGK